MTSNEINRRYSKSSQFYFGMKNEFFSDNLKLLKVAREMNRIYKNQPNRLVCKLCFNSLPSEDDFQSHELPYKFCQKCGHLNGKFQDSEEFFETLYLQSNGIEYNAASYIDESFISRVRDVYSPKVEFLREYISDNDLSVLDVGCGAGHFVAACIGLGVSAIGIDVSKTSIDFGNKNLLNQFKLEPLSHVSQEDYLSTILESDATVISLIGVIEHIQDLPKFFDAIKSAKAKYIYYSVPMVSLSVLIENIFPDIYPRHLSADHTHLFTETSLLKLNEYMGLTAIAEWRFGTDFTDLLRSFSVIMGTNHMTPEAQDYFLNKLNPLRDQLQSILDQNHFCSEIHVLAKRAVFS
jgi:SAM-dependent methyltransferase